MRHHRISLEPIGLDEWVEIPERRTFDVRTRVDEALMQGARAFNLARAVLYFQAWSFPEELSEARILATDDDIVTYVLSEAEGYYDRTRRTPAERKSDEGAASAGAGAAGLLAGDGPGWRRDSEPTGAAGTREVAELLAAGGA